MRVFLDTDVLLDVLLAREEHFQNSAAVVDWAEAHSGMAVTPREACSVLGLR